MARLEGDLIMDGELERLHAALVDALRRTRSAPFDGPVTVAEIYQDLVPYRTVRATLNFDMNADYEHTLLRLLAGEGDLARLDPPEARDELREELDSPNPNVGVFRKFAACDVWVVVDEDTRNAAAVPADADVWTPPALVEDDEPWSVEPLDPPPAGRAVTGHELPHAAEPATGPAADSPTERGEEAQRAAAPEPAVAPPTAAHTVPEAEPDGDDELVAEPAGDDEEAEYELVPVQRRAARGESGEGAHCVFCDSSLPERRMLRFCPHCGADQSQRPCMACGESLEPGWRYCVACGSAAEGGG